MARTAPTYQLGPDFDEKLEAFATAFLSAGWEVFRTEFAGIDRFLEEASRDSVDREDGQLRRTEKPHYLIEAVAYKIYDTLNREKFDHTAETLIVVADCLTLHNPYCLKEDLPHGDECAGCTPDCPVHRVTALAERFGATVIFSKRKLSEQLEFHQSKAKGLGVIGVGCLLMLARGMRTAMELGIPVRGVPLDYCGCEHWTDEPMGTTFPLERLEQILEEKNAVRAAKTDKR